MDAQRADPALKPDQPVSAELLSVWVGGHGAAELQLRLILLVQTDVSKVLLGRAKPHVVGNHLRRAAQPFISQHPEIRRQMLQMFFFLFMRKRFWRFWFQSEMIRFWFQTGMMDFKLGPVKTTEGFF